MIVILKIIFLINIVSLGNCLQCYTCQSQRDPQRRSACEIPVNNPNVPTELCNNQDICIKYTMRNGNSETINRKCAPRGKCDILRTENTEFNTLLSCNACNTDYCNSASLFSHSLFIILLSVVFCKFL